MLIKSIRLAAVLIVMLAALVVGAQDVPASAPADEMAGTPWDILGSVFGVLASVLVGGLGWLVARLSVYLSTKHKDAIWAGILIRFNEALFDAVEGEVAVLKAKFADATDPTSPGGERITATELEEIKDAVWEHLKAQYGGADGIKKALSILAGDDVERWVKTRISGAVADVERADRAAEAGNPK